MVEPFDLNAFIRAIVVSTAAGLLVGAVIYFALQTRQQWTKWKAAVILGLFSIAILLTVGIYYRWPSLISVPSLDGLSQAEAEDLLVKSRLIPNGRPQYSMNVPRGRAIPHSQSPSYGLAVRPGTIVTFAISMPQENYTIQPATADIHVALFQPKSAERIHCRPGVDGVFRCQVQGTCAGISSSGPGLLLWVRPVQPPADSISWYLQRPPTNGVTTVAANGSWVGVVQIGNVQWPPEEGNVVDIAVSAADRRTVDDLVSQPGVVIRKAPIGSQSDIASGVIVTLK